VQDLLHHLISYLIIQMIKNKLQDHLLTWTEIDIPSE